MDAVKMKADLLLEEMIMRAKLDLLIYRATIKSMGMPTDAVDLVLENIDKALAIAEAQ